MPTSLINRKSYGITRHKEKKEQQCIQRNYDGKINLELKGNSAKCL